ncbi:MAG: Maf family protein [Dehalococcoidia bacterium]
MTADIGSAGYASSNDSVLSPQSSELILASGSPRRRELLAALGVPFSVVVTHVDETIGANEEPAAAAGRLAQCKVEAVAGREPGAIVVGADTIVVLDGRVLGKPLDAAEAEAMLRALRGRAHEVISGFAMQDGRHGVVHVSAPETTVWMRDYTDAEIAASIAVGTPFDKAGAYAIQDAEFAPVERIEGCYCNVMGLPLWSVFGVLETTPNAPRPARPDDARAVCAVCPLAR